MKKIGFFFLVIFAIVGCKNNLGDSILEEDRVEFDENGIPYINGMVLSERQIARFLRGRYFKVEDEHISLVSPDGTNLVNVSDIGFIPEFYVDKNGQSLREFFYYNDGSGTERGVYKEYDFFVGVNGVVVSKESSELIMRIIRLGEKSFDAFIKINDLWAQVTYSISSQMDGLDEYKFGFEYFPQTVFFDSCGFPYFDGCSIVPSAFSELVDEGGWYTDGLHYYQVDKKTNKIRYLSDILPGYSIRFSAKDEMLTFYICREGGFGKREYCYRIFRYDVTSDGYVCSVGEDEEVIFRIVSVGKDGFKAFMNVGTDSCGEKQYDLLIFKKMSETMLKQHQETYISPYGAK